MAAPDDRLPPAPKALIRALLFSALLCFAGATASAPAQEPAGQPDGEGPGTALEPLSPGATLEVTPLELTLEVGEKTSLRAELRDGERLVVDRPVVFYSRSRRNVQVDAFGELEAFGPGVFTVVALVPKDPEDEPGDAEPILQVEVEVTVPSPPVRSVEIIDLPEHLYAGTTIALATRVVDTSGAQRTDVEASFESDDPHVAEPDGFGSLQLRSPGTTTIRARAERASSATQIRVQTNPVGAFELSTSAERVRTGDVVDLSAIGRDAEGRPVPDLPVTFTVAGRVDTAIRAPGASAQITEDAKFVAERSGTYTVVASTGSLSARRSIRVEPRSVAKEIRFVGQGKVRDRHTSDLWVWQGADGHDYAITGTWGAEGHAYIWDVTSPESIVLVDTVRVDARTVNDVKISSDGRLAVISREGASNRKNGIVVLDVSDPRTGVRVLSRYDDQLTGGVHNVFVYDHHVYAVNNGRRFDIISVEDPAQPHRVGRFELESPGHALHDVWVVDGVAFSSNWDEGVWAIDVGGGGKGGAPNRPVPLGHYRYPSGWNHAAFPYRSQSTGKFYVFAGDEAFPYGLSGREPGEAPPRAAGWVHVIEWDDWASPREVARYQVPEAGTHNLWIEDDVLYVAYYNGGLRVVDVSGELRGDLYAQGREIGLFMPFDPEGFIPNSPFVWGPQPYKGHVFFSDWNSGLWAVKLIDPEDPDRIVGEPR